MDGYRIQAKVNRGYAIAGGKLGLPYALYRPADPLAPIGTARATIKAAFDSAPPFAFGRPNEYGDPKWYGLFDGAQTQPGDYLIGVGGKWFIAAQQALLPILCIQTGRSVSLLRPSSPASVGIIDYQGVTAANEIALMSGWPASILRAGNGERGESGLPGEPKMGLYTILMPAWPGIAVLNGDVLQSVDGQRYAVSSAELTDLGWRINARVAAA